MNIGENLKELKKEEPTNQAISRIQSLVDVWDHNVAEVMREIVRLYNHMILEAHDGHEISFRIGEKMEDVFKAAVTEIIKETDKAE